MLHPRGWICEHPTVLQKSGISTVSGVYVTSSPAWQFPLSTAFLPFVASVRPDPGHFIETTTALRVQSENVVGDCRLRSASHDKWLLCWCERGLGAKGSELGSKHGVSPQVRTRTTGSPQVINIASDWWQCDRSESSAVKTKGGARWTDFAFYDKNRFSAEIRTKFD